jgi:hypothetical protein
MNDVLEERPDQHAKGKEPGSRKNGERISPQGRMQHVEDQRQISTMG